MIVHLSTVLLMIVPLKETQTLNYCTFLVFLALGISHFYIVRCKLKNVHTQKRAVLLTGGLLARQSNCICPLTTPNTQTRRGLITQTSIAVSTDPVAWQHVERPEVHWRDTIVLASVCWVMFYGWPNSPRRSCSTPKTWECLLTALSFKSFCDQSCSADKEIR